MDFGLYEMKIVRNNPSLVKSDPRPTQTNDLSPLGSNLSEVYCILNLAENVIKVTMRLALVWNDLHMIVFYGCHVRTRSRVSEKIFKSSMFGVTPTDTDDRFNTSFRPRHQTLDWRLWIARHSWCNAAGNSAKFWTGTCVWCRPYSSTTGGSFTGEAILHANVFLLHQ